MKARRIKREVDAGGNVLRRDLVFFGSYGKNIDGTAKFYNEEDKHDNFSDGSVGVADSLMARLNVLEGELWYKMDAGWPLWDKHKDSYTLDIYVSSTILQHPDVISIKNFVSQVKKSENNKSLIYFANLLIKTRYGDLTFDVKQAI